MISMQRLSVLFTVLILTTAATTPAQRPTVSDDLAERAAQIFAEQRWGSSTLIWRNPLYGLNGKIQAYSYLVYLDNAVPKEIEKAIEREDIDYLLSTSENLLGTVVISATRDEFPFLERYEGPPIEIVQKNKGKEIYKRTWGETGNPRFYRLGPGLIIGDYSEDKVLPSNGTITKGVFLSTQKPILFDPTPELATKPAMDPVTKFQSEQIWRKLEQTRSSKITMKFQRSEQFISGVPYYLQDDFDGPNSTICVQTATAQVLGYWDDNGYGLLVRGGNSNYTSGVRQMINDLKTTMGWSRDGATSFDVWDLFNFQGITRFTNDSEFGRNYNFQAHIGRLSTFSEAFVWTDVVSEIDAGRPIIYMIGLGGNLTHIGDHTIENRSLATFGHAMTAVGYESWDIGIGTDLHIVKVHYNHLIGGQRRPLEIINNTSTQKVTIKVQPGRPPQSIDLVATSIDGPGEGTQGGSISVYRIISNGGATNAGRFKIKYYFSSNRTISDSDFLLGEEEVTSLNGGFVSGRNVNITVPARVSTGSYYLGMIVDADNAIFESNEGNNIERDSEIIVIRSGGRPNLVATSIDGPSSGSQGGSISVRRRVSNDGNAASGTFKIGYYLSTNRTISTGDNLLGKEEITLNAGSSSDIMVSINIPNSISIGTFYLGMIVDVDEDVTESNEDNNIVRDSGTINIGSGGGLSADRYENDNTRSSATQIATDGTSQTHTVHVNNDNDYVYFEAQSGVQYTIETTGNIDTELTIYNSSGTQLAHYDNDRVAGNNERETFSRSGSGNLRTYVKINERGQNDTGTYTISVTSSGGGLSADRYENDNTRSSATQIATDGTSQTHTVHVNNDNDYVYFEAQSGVQYTIETTGNIDTELTIYNSSGRQLSNYDNDRGSENNERETFSRSGSGNLRTYIRVIEHRQDNTGSYTIFVTREGG